MIVAPGDNLIYGTLLSQPHEDYVPTRRVYSLDKNVYHDEIILYLLNTTAYETDDAVCLTKSSCGVMKKYHHCPLVLSGANH